MTQTVSRQGTAKGAKAIAAMRAQHRKQRLVEIARATGQVMPVQLLEKARDEGLEPTLDQCRDVLHELYPAPVLVPGGNPRHLLATAKGLLQPFTLSQLVVAAWRNRPDLFSLDDHPDYPSEHKVRCALWGPRGLVGRGFLVKDGEMFRVSGGES